MATIAANYDGPLYIAVAKSFYDKSVLSSFSFGLPSEYYAAHFPLYPLLINIFATITGYPYATLLVTLLTSILALWFFYYFIKDVVGEQYAMLFTLFFSIFPARWLIVRSVGSPEPLFLASTIASVYYFRNKKYLYSGIWGAVAQLTKSPGILLFIAYAFAVFIPLFNKFATSTNKASLLSELKKYFGLLLIPFSLLGVFYIYKLRMDDFWAYFNSGDNIHLFFPPFQIFNYSAAWVGTFWLEEIIFVYLFSGLGLLKLIRMKENTLAWVVGIFFSTILFVSHRDLVRYSLPVVPFLFAGFSKQIVDKDFKYIIILLIIPIYLFSLVFISQNVMPISNWGPLL